MPPSKHPLVALLCSFSPVVSDLPGNFLRDATSETNSDMCLQTVNWMNFMTIGIFFWSLHSTEATLGSWNHHGGSVASNIIFENKFWSGQ